MKKLLSLFILCLGLSAFAGDITSKLPATLFEPAATNTTTGGVIGWNRDQIAVVQFAILTTNVAHATTRSNLYIRFDASANGTDWVASQYVVSVAPITTADVYTSGITRITNTVGGQWLRIGQIENANTNRVWVARLSFDTQ